MLSTSDPGAAHAFYGGLFGWTAEEAGEEYGGYVNYAREGRRVAGCMKNDGASGMSDAWSVYLATDDAAKTAEAAVAHGGQLVVPAMDVMDLGAMAVVTDAGQAAVGAWQAGSHAGFEITAEPGTPGWFELHTRDYEAAVAFYRDVFRWDTHVAADEPGFRYTTLGAGEAALAGIIDAAAFLPEGVPAHWSVYFAVDDVDAALARVVELGGTVTQAPEDSPYGRLAQAADPTGALFKLVGR